MLVTVLLVLGVLLVLSPGKPKPILDEAGKPILGSISEKIRVPINGAQQGMVIKSRDPRNPVLLVLHGGMPEQFLTDRYPTGLDEDFTVVWWDQRGSGLSFDPKAAPGSVNPEQLVSDTIAVTNYLRGRFAQDKIYLMGHSGGTFIGIQAGAREPQLYHAYIAVAQMTHQIESEQLAHDYMLREFRANGDTNMARKLEAAPVTNAIPLPMGYARVRDVAMHKLGVGTIREMRSIISGVLVPSFMSREYTLAEKVGLWRGKILSGSRLWNAQLSTDLRAKITRLDVPVYFVHGTHDYTVSYPLAKAYFEQLDAPVKGFYTFAQSAHSPHMEEPAKMCEMMQTDVLTGTKRHADER